jgi:hypothetical protein
MSSSIFDLEQQIMECWGVIDDIKMVTESFVLDVEMSPELADEIHNKYSAVQELYELKFKNLWNTFEKTAGEYHGKSKGDKNEDSK